MRVGVERQRDCRMAQALRNDFEVDTGLQELAGVRVPQVVQSNMRHL